MSLRHALIGLLAGQPASGWRLTRRFEDLLGTVWPAGHPQIYGELRKLHDDGFIQVVSEGPRRRKTYRATESGVEEVRRWLTAVEADHTLRLEPVLRSVFFWLMTPEELAAHLEKEAAFYRDLAQNYRELAPAKDRGEYGDNPQTRSIRIAAEAGIRLHQALGDWATWAGNHQPGVP